MEDLSSAYNQNAQYFIEHFADAEHLSLEAHTEGQETVLKPVGWVKRDQEELQSSQALEGASRSAMADGEVPKDKTNPLVSSQGRKMVANIFDAQFRRNLSRNARQQQSVVPSSKVRWVDDDDNDADIESAESSTQPAVAQATPDETALQMELEKDLEESLIDSEDENDRLRNFKFPALKSALKNPSSFRPLDTSEGYTTWNPERDETWFAEPPCDDRDIAQKVPYDFLDPTHKGTATLTYNDANGSLIAIHNLDVTIINARSALLAAAFEAADPKQQLHLDIISPRSVEPFLRYLYTGEYAITEDASVSLLLHCELHFIATVFDLTGLKSQALINTIYCTQFACSSPDKPIDLFAAIRFCYMRYQANAKLIEHILAYIIAQFDLHRFEYDADFLALYHEHRQFQTELSQANMTRLTDGSAVDAIFRLTISDQPFTEYQSYEDPNNRRVQDVVHYFHGTDTFEEDRFSKRAGKRAKVEAEQKTEHAVASIGSETPLWKAQTGAPAVSALTLALRGKPVDEAVGFQSDTSSEDEGFHIVKPESESGASTPTKESGFVLVGGPRSSGAVIAATERFRRRKAEKRAQNAKDQNDIESTSSDSDWSLLS